MHPIPNPGVSKTIMDPQGSEHRRLLSVSIASHMITDDNTINDVIKQRHDLTSDIGPKRDHFGEKNSGFFLETHTL